MVGSLLAEGASPARRLREMKQAVYADLYPSQPPSPSQTKLSPAVPSECRQLRSTYVWLTRSHGLPTARRLYSAIEWMSGGVMLQMTVTTQQQNIWMTSVSSSLELSAAMYSTARGPSAAQGLGARLTDSCCVSTSSATARIPAAYSAG